MTHPPRTLLNRLLLSLIAVMTLAIFVLGGLIVWRVLTPGQAQETILADVRSFAIEGAAVSYRVPAGCTDTPSIDQSSITITFTGDTCSEREILSLSGDVRLQ